MNEWATGSIPGMPLLLLWRAWFEGTTYLPPARHLQQTDFSTQTAAAGGTEPAPRWSWMNLAPNTFWG